MAGDDRTKPSTKKRGGGRLAISISGGGGILIAGGALIALGAAFLFRRYRANKKTQSPPPPPPPLAQNQAEELQAKESNDVVKGGDLGLQSLVSLVQKVGTCEITTPDGEVTSEKSEIKHVIAEEVEEIHVEEKETVEEVAESEASVEERSFTVENGPAETVEEEAESAAMEKEEKVEEDSDAVPAAMMEFQAIEKEVVMTKMMMAKEEKNIDVKVIILLLALIMALGIVCSYVHSLSSKE